MGKTKVSKSKSTQKRSAAQGADRGIESLLGELAAVHDETDPERDRIIHEVGILVKERPTPNASAAALMARRNVLWALGAAGRRGLSKKELIKVTQCSWTNIQKRLEELLKEERIEPAGRAVWRMVPEKCGKA